MKAGRGFGKTRTGAELIREWKEDVPIIHLIGPTASDVRDVMIEGPAGILNISPRWDRPSYEPSKRKLTWKNGASALLFSADEPDRLRGPQCYKAWADEPASWRYEETWDQMSFGLRLGLKPQVVATTTPRPTKLIKGLVARDGKDVAVTSGVTYENRANLADAFFTAVIRKYEGTRLGRQELNAEILEDVDGALWTRGLIEANRVRTHPTLKRIVIAIDPAVTAEEDSDETGIVPAGLGMDGHGYVLDDLSDKYSPDAWAKKAVAAYHQWQADAIIAEVNNGGDMVEHTIKTIDRSVRVKKVHATRGKLLRAEPVAALDEQHKVHHVGCFPQMEDQMCNWVQGDRSPDRLDARVWAITDLILQEQREWRIS